MAQVPSEPQTNGVCRCSGAREITRRQSIFLSVEAISQHFQERARVAIYRQFQEPLLVTLPIDRSGALLPSSKRNLSSASLAASEPIASGHDLIDKCFIHPISTRLAVPSAIYLLTNSFRLELRGRARTTAPARWCIKWAPRLLLFDTGTSSANDLKARMDAA